MNFKDEEEQAEIELPSGLCLLIAVNGVLSGIPLPISGGVFTVLTDEEFDPSDLDHYQLTFKPIRYC